MTDEHESQLAQWRELIIHNLAEFERRARTAKYVNSQPLDLHGINLRGMNLKDIAFSGANLKNSDLSFTNAQKVHLSSTDLSGANFQYADLRHAGLDDVTVKGTDFRHAMFSSRTLVTILRRRGAVLDKEPIIRYNMEEDATWELERTRAQAILPQPAPAIPANPVKPGNTLDSLTSILNICGLEAEVVQVPLAEAGDFYAIRLPQDSKLKGDLKPVLDQLLDQSGLYRGDPHGRKSALVARPNLCLMNKEAADRLAGAYESGNEALLSTMQQAAERPPIHR